MLTKLAKGASITSRIEGIDGDHRRRENWEKLNKGEKGKKGVERYFSSVVFWLRIGIAAYMGLATRFHNHHTSMCYCDLKFSYQFLPITIYTSSPSVMNLVSRWLCPFALRGVISQSPRQLWLEYFSV